MQCSYSVVCVSTIVQVPSIFLFLGYGGGGYGGGYGGRGGGRGGSRGGRGGGSGYGGGRDTV